MDWSVQDRVRKILQSLVLTPQHFITTGQPLMAVTASFIHSFIHLFLHPYLRSSRVSSHSQGPWG